MGKLKALIFDLDSTVANINHRLHHIIGKVNSAKNYKKFFETLEDDIPNDWCVEMMYHFSMSGYHIFIITARPDTFGDRTEAWLKKYGIPHDVLIMRKKGDFRKDSIVKKEIYKECIEKNYDIKFVVDDRAHVVEMWRSLGLTCLQCAKGDY